MTPSSIAFVLTMMAALANDGVPVDVACEIAPASMACVPGGAASVGRDDGPANEKPKRSVEISTFYVDMQEIKVREYQECVEAKVCPPSPLKGVSPDEIARGLDYERALKYCAWRGKRLPTE